MLRVEQLISRHKFNFKSTAMMVLAQHLLIVMQEVLVAGSCVPEFSELYYVQYVADIACELV